MEKRGALGIDHGSRCEVCEAPATAMVGGVPYCHRCVSVEHEKRGSKVQRRLKSVFAES